MIRCAVGRGANMYAVGRLISQGVYTVAGPFHPFGGAVDIIVVQQQDGSYKSSPWYVKFGKFQGVLKRSEKVVNIAVNDEALKFHMYLDSTGEAYFLKDVEPEKVVDKEPLAITLGEEALALALAGGPRKLEDGLESKEEFADAEGEEFADAEEDAEKSESSDEKDSKLALRFEGRKASYLLVQQARAAEEAKGGAEVAESSGVKGKTGVTGEAPNELLSSLAALKLRSSSVAELENATGGSAIHALLNQTVGLEESQRAGRPSCSLVAETALVAVTKVALESRGEGSSHGIENGCRESVEAVEGVSDRSEATGDGCQLGKSKSMNVRSGQTVDEPVCVRRVKSESDLGLLASGVKRIKSESDLRLHECGDNSPELSTLTITSADGVVVLQTPRRASPPELPLQEEPVETPQHQLPLMLDGDGLERPLVVGMVAFEEVATDVKPADCAVEKPEAGLEEKEVGALIRAGSGGWKLWPFPLRRQKTADRNGSEPVISREALLIAAKAGVDSALMSNLVSESDYYVRCRKNKVRSFLPTSQMLASMNLKEGRNRITFTFFTRVLGKQQVDARIYLWKWNTRVVISDVDGTITKSDVLGQVMPLVGRDWTQSGVTRLFSAIKENGYEVMFLSARAISQAYLTRQFLLNLKQDGEALPDGPVVISPDGLFPSLYREVIRRAPHEFKIACLQDIRDLFPEDCNPFYAGFGNRDTDEISYLKVGIPKGKIFIINPKGEVAVNNRVDVKSYTSLHKLVDDMFPPQTYTEQEDFNSWNYWKMPLPDIEDELSAKSGSKASGAKPKKGK